jgi:hypothetical protein
MSMSQNRQQQQQQHRQQQVRRLLLGAARHRGDAAFDRWWDGVDAGVKAETGRTAVGDAADWREFLRGRYEQGDTVEEVDADLAAQIRALRRRPSWRARREAPGAAGRAGPRPGDSRRLDDHQPPNAARAKKGSTTMAWERGYYYRIRKVNGRVVRGYCGSGLLAQFAAQHDELERQVRNTRRRAELRHREEMEALDAQVNAVNEMADLLAKAALLVAGYRQHDRGHGRRKRGNTDQRR